MNFEQFINQILCQQMADILRSKPFVFEQILLKMALVYDIENHIIILKYQNT